MSSEEQPALSESKGAETSIRILQIDLALLRLVLHFGRNDGLSWKERIKK